MGFDGLVVSDWNGIGQVAGLHQRELPAGDQRRHRRRDGARTTGRRSSPTRSPRSSAGEIPMARIDDAVTRILRVKLRAGLIDQPKPSRARARRRRPALAGAGAGAREAVRESLVLLKNDEQRAAARRELEGAGGRQERRHRCRTRPAAGRLTWQGTGNTNADFPNGTTILGGPARGARRRRRDVHARPARASTRRSSTRSIAVIGETPYAEGIGDLGKRSLRARRACTRRTSRCSTACAGKGAPVVDRVRRRAGRCT